MQTALFEVTPKEIIGTASELFMTARFLGTIVSSEADPTSKRLMYRWQTYHGSEPRDRGSIDASILSVVMFSATDNPHFSLILLSTILYQ